MTVTETSPRFQPSAKESPTQNKPQSVQLRKILFIDDNALVRESYEALLAKHGYHIFTVDDGSKGLSVLRKEEFDVVICDVRMPGMTGIEFVKSAREIWRGKKHDLPIIFLTAYADPALEEQAKALHPFAYLYKPAEDIEILEALKRCFYLSDSSQAA